MSQNDDLISRQAAIDTLDKHLRTTDVPVSYPGIISALTEWLNELPSAQADLDEVYAHAETEAEARYHAEIVRCEEDVQHWIPCSERLPETEEQVLIYAWNVHYVLAKYKEIRTCDDVYKMAWVTEDAYSIPREIKHEVICWMPLPEVYREGAQE